MFSGGCDGVLKLWDVESGTCLRTLAGHENSISSVAITPDGRWAISGSYYGVVMIWDLESGEDIASFTADAGIGRCAIGPDGKTFIVGDWLGRMHFLRLEGA